MADVKALPWERQPGEPPRAWESFVIYRDMGLSRSIAKVAEQMHVSPNTPKSYARLWDWVSRATEWDREQDRLDLLWLQDERRKAVTRHVRQAQGLQSKWIQALQTLQPGSLTASEVIRFAEVATKMERDALNMAQQIDVNVSGVVGHVDLGSLNPDEVAHRLEVLQAEVRNRIAEARAITDGSEQ